VLSLFFLISSIIFGFYSVSSSGRWIDFYLNSAFLIFVVIASIATVALGVSTIVLSLMNPQKTEKRFQKVEKIFPYITKTVWGLLILLIFMLYILKNVHI
jgi:hypothetical protein